MLDYRLSGDRTGNRYPSRIKSGTGIFLITLYPDHVMTIRVRKLVGMLLLMVLICVWALIAMGIAVTVLPQVGMGWALLYYAIVGMGWVLPAMPIISWMQRPDA
jgi:hypothetical protein